MALVINRTPQEQFFITHPEGRITVTVLDVSGPNVRIAIDAPRSVEIARDNMKKLSRRDSSCWKCGAEDMGDSGGLCWSCFKTEQED